MMKSTKGILTMVIVLIAVFMLLSPAVFAKWMVDLDDEGLKSLHVRADIYKGSMGEGISGPKHGRVQLLITEIEPKLYSYKFMIHLRKALPDTEYEIYAWATMPDIKFTLYGDGSDAWEDLEKVAHFMDLEMEDPDIPGQVTTSLSRLGLTGFQDALTGMKFTTDWHGSYKNIKSGVMTETNAMEYVLDLSWPVFTSEYPALEFLFGEGVDFADFGINKIEIHPDIYVVTGGLDFVCMDPYDVYCTEKITVTYDTAGFIWEK